jgi:hypothetical protein
MFDYKIVLNFNPEKAKKAEIDAFCEFASKYDALCLRKEKDSRMYLPTEKCMDVGILELNKGINKKLAYIMRK